MPLTVQNSNRPAPRAFFQISDEKEGSVTNPNSFEAQVKTPLTEAEQTSINNQLLNAADKMDLACIVKANLNRRADLDAKSRALGLAMTRPISRQHGSEYRINIVKIILSSRANVNFQDEFGKTALMHASKENRIEIVELLLASGAMVELQDKTGNTALTQLASVNFLYDKTKLLLENAIIKQKNEQKIALILGLHARVGFGSSVRRAWTTSQLAEFKVLRLMLHYL